MASRRSPQQRLRDIEWALKEGLEQDELVRMLEGLLSVADADADEMLFATVKLAELLAAEQPWRAAVLAKRSLRITETAHGWAVLALAQSSLGNYRLAVKSYRRALLLVPENPWYCHNLGHLLDVALDRPLDGSIYLERAHLNQPAEPEIASSYAHALARIGRHSEALALLERSTGSADAALGWLKRWSLAPPRGSQEESCPDSAMPSVAPPAGRPSRP